MREQILFLRSQGKTYDEIAKEVNLSKSTISYYCSEESKDTTLRRRKRLAKSNIARLKQEYGGKCSICGYDKCSNALEFHHTNPENKKHEVLYLLRNFSYKAAAEEAKKCILVCANCHREIHSK